ncbi:hypothetical protein AHAS_Ahas18G0237500 [Arachis hypogaea]
MTITLQDMAYQLGVRINGDLVSGCISGWEQHHDGWSIENFYQQLLGGLSTVQIMPEASTCLGITGVDRTPYADPQLHDLAPPGIAEAKASTTVVCLLLCYAIVKWHQID